MAKEKSTSKESGSFVSSLLNKIWGLGLQPLLETFVRNLEERVELWERRVLALAAAYFGMMAGFFFLVLGVFFILMDYAGLPRGAVFTVGGLFILIISFILTKVGKKR